MRIVVVCLALASLAWTSSAEARLVRLRVESRELVLGGRGFGQAGSYEKLIGKAEFAVDPSLLANGLIVDLRLAQRNAQGEVEFTADFYLLRPVDPQKANGRLLYEVSNRGGKNLLVTFQKAVASDDPTTETDFGDGSLMNQGYTLLWMGWQWDVPDGRMRMAIPIASDNGRAITGLVRGNFILNQRSATASVADAGHKAYPAVAHESPQDFMTVRDERRDAPQIVARARWRFVDSRMVTLDGGFEPGRIYDVVYRATDPRVVGLGLAGTRDIVSFFKYERGDANPAPTIRYAIGYGRSQSGRFLRHFIYQGFNADERGRLVFNGVLDVASGAGRGSFNHRFAQASRDAREHHNFLFPVDLFPFTDGPSTDPETGVTDGLLALAARSGTAPKIFHVLTNSEYFNRAGSLIHTDPTGARDAKLPPNTRIYLMSSAPHFPRPFPPETNRDGSLAGVAALSPLDYFPVLRALMQAMDQWVVEDALPPPSRYPRLMDRTLVARDASRWPAIPGFRLPPPQFVAYRLDFGPRWKDGLVDFEPPLVGMPFGVRVPAVDADGNDRAGIRLPEVAAPLATYAGWNYRDPSIGAPAHLAGEIGSYIPFAKSRSERVRVGDSRLSIKERYPDKAHYMRLVRAAAVNLVRQRFVLQSDLSDMLSRASAHYDWAMR
ncbi:MAG: alpha/beta hydrolase domain-containing protein [Gemmatimonadaceae bacterium]